jgi:succinate dehydrogenase flavin-adding protein (antitoxin of CptAB toxin-antitoxin module)
LPGHDDIFDRLKQDHDLHRELFDRLARGGEERGALLTRLTKELKAHASAEEQALYSTMLRKPETTDETRHSVAEHKEIEDLLNDLAAVSPQSSEWEAKLEHLHHRYIHHIDEEEDEHFPDFSRYLTQEDEQFMRTVFERRKQAEQAQAEVTPEKLEDAKE